MGVVFLASLALADDAAVTDASQKKCDSADESSTASDATQSNQSADKHDGCGDPPPPPPDPCDYNTTDCNPCYDCCYYVMDGADAGANGSTGVVYYPCDPCYPYDLCYPCYYAMDGTEAPANDSADMAYYACDPCPYYYDSSGGATTEGSSGAAADADTGYAEPAVIICPVIEPVETAAQTAEA